MFFLPHCHGDGSSQERKLLPQLWGLVIVYLVYVTVCFCLFFSFLWGLYPSSFLGNFLDRNLLVSLLNVYGGGGGRISKDLEES